MKDEEIAMVTLLSYREVTVEKEDGTFEDVNVKQLPIKQYEAGFQRLDDEFALTALAVGKPKEWILTLKPEGYEALSLAVREVNDKGFFVYAARRQDALMRRINSVSPATLQAAIKSSSPTSSPELHLRPV